MPILLCSTDTAVRKRWQDLLADKEVVQAGTSAELEFLLCEKQNFELILIHRSMVDFETTAQISRLAPSSKLFILTDRPDEEEGLTFLKLGVVGYANTFISPARLAEAVSVVLSGTVWVGQKVMQRLIRDTLDANSSDASPHTTHRVLDMLTPRESEITGLIAKGRTNLEIAYDLDISERTVKAHLSSIYAKTETGNRLSLALLVNKG